MEKDDWTEFGREVMMTEAIAIQHAAERMGDEFSRALDLLDTCSGKAVTSGVGKSGLAARKLAATLTSIGCPAVFLHPSEAMHGDLGIVAPEDVVIVLSHSGESEELLAVLPALINRGAAIIAISGNLDSTLTRVAQVTLDASIEREACPLNLAPTTSVMTALALGDALAMTLQKRRKLDANDYALNHPGGRLGRRLTLRVRDVMVNGQSLPHVTPDASFQRVVCELTSGHMGAVAVLAEDDILVGIIAESDLRKTLIGGASAWNLTAQDMMNSNPVLVLKPDMLAYEAQMKMTGRVRPISVAPVLDEREHCVGMLRINDLVRAGL